MSRPRIVFAANTIDEVGGAQRVVHVVAQGLAERGHSVDVVGVAPFEPRHTFVADPAFRRFVLMDQAWPPPPPASDFRLARHLQPSVRRRIAERRRLADEAARAMARVLADGPTGVVVTAQLWAMETLARTPHEGWRVIGQYHSSFEAAAGGRDLARALALYRDVDVVTLLTPSDARSFQHAGLDSTAWLPNPLAFWPTVPAEPIHDGTVVYLGRFSPEKGWRGLLEAWPAVMERHPGWRLQMIGSGPDERAVHQAAQDLTVDVLPPTQDAQAALRRASIVVLPSLTEGLPLVMAEAMALGLPVVATDCSSGVRLLAEDGRVARLVPRYDPDGLADAISALAADPAERVRLGAQARASIEQYRLDAVLDRWEELLARVLR